MSLAGPVRVQRDAVQGSGAMVSAGQVRRVARLGTHPRGAAPGAGAPPVAIRVGLEDRTFATAASHGAGVRARRPRGAPAGGDAPMVRRSLFPVGRGCNLPPG